MTTEIRPAAALMAPGDIVVLGWIALISGDQARGGGNEMASGTTGRRYYGRIDAIVELRCKRSNSRITMPRPLASTSARKWAQINGGCQ